MARVAVHMPKFGMTMLEGLIVEWHYAVGDEISEGDLLLTIETEKVNTDVESPASGTLAEIVFKADAEVPVGETIAYIDSPH